VPAGQIREVYREGEALHLTFSTADRAQARVSCWAADASTAAEIVQLLPTRRTVELEHTTDRLAGDRPRYDRRVLAMLAVVSMAGAAIWLWPRNTGTAKPDALPLLEAPVIPAEVNLAPPLMVLPDDFIIPIPHDAPQYAVASVQLAAFEDDAERLLADYRVDRALLESGAMDTETFANRLGGLELEWWNATYRMLDDDQFGDLALLEVRSTLLSAARHWRAFLADQADALRKGDNVGIAKSFDELARSRINTNSSAAVGCSATVESHCFLVSPAFTATAASCAISGASSPAMCTPNNWSVLRSTTSFMSVRSWLPESMLRMGRKFVR
jgi:hypothetical protein